MYTPHVDWSTYMYMLMLMLMLVSTTTWVYIHVDGPHVSTYMSVYVLSRYYNTILAMGYSNHLRQFLAYKTDKVL